jgi:SulP family sulfate permease
VLFLAKTSTPKIPTLAFDTADDGNTKKLINIEQKPVKQCPQLKIIRIDMSVYFGSITHIQKRLAQISDNERINHILIVASGINFIDLAGSEALIAENNRLKKINGGLYFVGLKASVYESVAKSSFIKKIGNNHFFDSKTHAISTIYKFLNTQECAVCDALVYKECQ